MEVLALASLIGTLLGVLGGYVGGWLDEVVMRITDVFLAFPYLILAMAMVAAIGPSLVHATLALSLVWWAQYACLMRMEVRRVKRREFVEAAYALGGYAGRVVARHVRIASYVNSNGPTLTASSPGCTQAASKNGVAAAVQQTRMSLPSTEKAPKSRTSGFHGKASGPASSVSMRPARWRVRW